MNHLKAPLGFIIVESDKYNAIDSTHKVEDLAKDLNFEICTEGFKNLDPLSPKLIYQDGKWKLFTRDQSVKLTIDFLERNFFLRVKSPSINHENLVRAVKGRKVFSDPLYVLDATAGLGRDAFLLAASGCNVIAIEKIKVIFFLLEEALKNISLTEDSFSTIVKRLEFKNGDSIKYMDELSGRLPDVIYLDPMYISTTSRGLKKTALTKKSIKILQDVYSFQVESGGKKNNSILKSALSIAKRKVVVKRPPHSDFLEGIKPSSSLIGKTARFDIYPTY